MRLSIGSDHRGVELKAQLIDALAAMGHQVSDEGPTEEQSVDYPEYAAAVAKRIVTGDCELGILVCGTGIGMSIAANKVRGVRAALCSNETMAMKSREHNNSNIICLGADGLEADEAKRIVETWLTTSFAAGRHENRVNKIHQLES